MAQVLVVADDLTGANATGARFARAGLRVVTVAPEHVTRAAADYDVVVANLDSRHLPVRQAKDLVADVIEAVWPVRLVVKRTDTTLRGNVGGEIEAAWRAVAERMAAGTDARVLFAPAHPASGRVAVDGVQLLDGVALERTELALDPLSPMHTSVITEILAHQTQLPVRHVPIREITGPDLAQTLGAGEEPIVLCDALTEEHLGDVAQAAAGAAEHTGTVWLAADPGPLSALLADALGISGRHSRIGPLLAVVGSATELTRRQLAAVTGPGSAESAAPVGFIDVDVRGLEAEPYRRELAARLSERFADHPFPGVVGLRTAGSSADVVELASEERAALPTRLAGVVAEAVETARRTGSGALLPSGLYTSGGEVTTAVLEALGAHAFEVGGEVMPLAVHGTLIGGPLDGTPMVTKGGLIGGDDAVADCLQQLRRSAQARLRHVRAEVQS